MTTSLNKILIIDDDPAILNALKRYFRRRGYITLLANDGFAALELFAAHRPALVLADIGIPRVSGLEVIRQIKRLHPDTAAILMTGNPQRDAAISGLKAGAMDFLSKPFSHEELEASVQSAKLQCQENAARRERSEELKRLVAEKESSLRQAEKELNQSAKMCALGELTAGLTHEINQPLTALKLTCQDLLSMANDSSQSQEDLHKCMEEIVGHVDGIVEIVEHMRNFARTSESDDQQLIDINHLIRDVLNLTHRQFRNQGIAVHMELFPEIPLFQSNRVKLEQVLMNLLSNARDALAECQKSNKTISISSRMNTSSALQQELLISIEDNAEGIPEKIRDKIFQPFFTTKKEGHGTGLGLSISKRIMESLGGQLSLESTCGEGSTFMVILPITRNSCAKAA